MIISIPEQLNSEKYLEKLHSMAKGPINQRNLFLGILLSHFILRGIIFGIVNVLCCIYYPISFFTIIGLIIIYFLILILFFSLSLIIDTIESSNIIAGRIIAIITLIFVYSSPFLIVIFPSHLQDSIFLSPFNPIFNLLYFIWLESNIFYSILSHIGMVIIFIFLLIFLILIGHLMQSKIRRTLVTKSDEPKLG